MSRIPMSLLAMALLLPSGAMPAAGNDGDTANTAAITVDVNDGRISIHPDTLTLHLDRPRFVVWQLSDGGTAPGSTLAVAFDKPLFPMETIRGEGSCTAGPAPIDVQPGTYTYSITVSDANGQRVGNARAAIAMREFSGIPSWVMPVTVGVLLLFLLFNYIEPPILRQSEPDAH